jgi:hypothetical protein
MSNLQPTHGSNSLGNKHPMSSVESNIFSFPIPPYFCYLRREACTPPKLSPTPIPMFNTLVVFHFLKILSLIFPHKIMLQKKEQDMATVVATWIVWRCMLVALMLYTVISTTTCKSIHFSSSVRGGMLSQEYNLVNKFCGMEIDNLSHHQYQ